MLTDSSEGNDVTAEKGDAVHIFLWSENINSGLLKGNLDNWWYVWETVGLNDDEYDLLYYRFIISMLFPCVVFSCKLILMNGDCKLNTRISIYPVFYNHTCKQWLSVITLFHIEVVVFSKTYFETIFAWTDSRSIFSFPRVCCCERTWMFSGRVYWSYCSSPFIVVLLGLLMAQKLCLVMWQQRIMLEVFCVYQGNNK